MAACLTMVAQILVAQICNLLYRRFATCSAPFKSSIMAPKAHGMIGATSRGGPNPKQYSPRLPNYALSRLKIGDTVPQSPDKSALLWRD
jgi:hypothetical protein